MTGHRREREVVTDPFARTVLPPPSYLKDSDNCGHQRIERFTTGDNVFSIWACGDCSLRFYPACSTCVDVGHRNVVHPGPAIEGSVT